MSSFLGSVKGMFGTIAKDFGITATNYSQQTNEKRSMEKMARLLMAGGSRGYPGAWTADRTEQVNHFRGVPYIAIKAIMDTVARHPPKVGYVESKDYITAKGLGKKCLDKLQREKALTHIQDHENIIPADGDDPLVQLLNNPNEPDVPFSFWSETMLYLETTGTNYWWAIDDYFDEPCQLWVMPSHWMWPISSETELVSYYQCRPFNQPGGGRIENIAANQIIPMSYKGPLSKIDGYSPMQAVAPWVDTGESLDKQRWWSFENAANPGFIFGMDAGMETPDPGEITAFLEDFNQRMNGVTNTGKNNVLNPGMSILRNGRSPAEMDFVNSFEQVRDAQLAAWRVPKSVAGLTDDISRANGLAANAQFIEGTILPRLVLLGQIGTEKLAKRFRRDGRRRIIYWDSLMPDDPTEKLMTLQGRWQMESITRDEVRKEYGQPPLPGGIGNAIFGGGAGGSVSSLGGSPAWEQTIDQLFAEASGGQSRTGETEKGLRRRKRK